VESKGFYLDRVRLYWRNARKGRYSNASRRVAFGGREHERILTRQTFSEGGDLSLGRRVLRGDLSLGRRVLRGDLSLGRRVLRGAQG
jgi:hypothetical protein